MSLQQTEEGLIGISLRENQLRMVQAVTTTGDCRISKVAQGEMQHAFTFQSIGERSQIAAFARDIDRIAEAAGFSTDRAALSLDAELVLIKKVPVDATLQKDELRDHIRWEISQYVLSPLDNYVIDYEELTPNGAGGAESNVVIVSIRKAVVDYIREVFAATRLHLRAVDVDVFAAHRVVSRTFDFSPQAKIALVDLRNRNLQFSILQNGFYLAQEVDYPQDDIMDPSAPPEVQLARTISKELRRIILDNKLGKSIEDLHKIFIYGDKVEDAILEHLSEEHKVSFQRINPFEKIQLMAPQIDREVTKHPEAFVTSVGVAIKGF